jgi:hypothetical protein
MDFRLIIKQKDGTHLDAGDDTSIDGVAPVSGDLLMSSTAGAHGVTQVEALRVIRRAFCAGRSSALRICRPTFMAAMGYVGAVAVG